MPQTPTDSLAASPGDIGTVEDIVLESATPTPSRNQLDDLRGIASDRGGPQPEEIEDAIDTIGNPPVVDGNNPPSPQQEGIASNIGKLPVTSATLSSLSSRRYPWAISAQSARCSFPFRIGLFRGHIDASDAFPRLSPARRRRPTLC